VGWSFPCKAALLATTDRGRVRVKSGRQLRSWDQFIAALASGVDPRPGCLHDLAAPLESRAAEARISLGVIRILAG
jgi:hypothetical protein